MEKLSKIRCQKKFSPVHAQFLDLIVLFNFICFCTKLRVFKKLSSRHSVVVFSFGGALQLHIIYTYLNSDKKKSDSTHGFFRTAPFEKISKGVDFCL